jgi:hypothetical protein
MFGRSMNAKPLWNCLSRRLHANLSSSRAPTAILMMNMGGPERPEDTHDFLKNLFTDNDIIPWGGGRFQELLGSFVAKRRTPRIAKQYDAIGGSPIRRWTEVQVHVAQHTTQSLSTCTPVLRSCHRRVAAHPGQSHVQNSGRAAARDCAAQSVHRLPLRVPARRACTRRGLLQHSAKRCDTSRCNTVHHVATMSRVHHVATMSRVAT